MTTAFHERLVALGVPHVWKDYGAGCHTIPNFRREFTDSLPGLERAFANPRPDPATFSYRSIEPRFSIWGWRIDADPARALEFLELAGRRPRRHDARRLRNDPRHHAAVLPRPPRRRRRHSQCDQGRSRPTATAASASPSTSAPRTPTSRTRTRRARAGDGTPGYFTRRRVSFAPHARLVLGRLRIRHSRARACLRSVGPVVRSVRISLSNTRARRVARSRRITVGSAMRCVPLTGAARLRRGRYVMRVSGTDLFGHQVAASRRYRLAG